MNTLRGATALQTVISLALLAVVIQLYHNVAVAWFRQRMFALRDDLFDMAACGEIDFDSPAYGLLRTTMNGFIRYGHRLNLLTAILKNAAASRADPALLAQWGYAGRWNSAVAELSPELTRKLEIKVLRMHHYLLTLLLFGTPLAAALTIPGLIGLVFKSWSRSCIAYLLQLIPQRTFDTIDATAFECGSPA